MRIFLKFGTRTYLQLLKFNAKRTSRLRYPFSILCHFSIVIHPLSVIVKRLLKLNGGGS